MPYQDEIEYPTSDGICFEAGYTDFVLLRIAKKRGAP